MQFAAGGIPRLSLSPALCSGSWSGGLHLSQGRARATEVASADPFGLAIGASASILHSRFDSPHVLSSPCIEVRAALAWGSQAHHGQPTTWTGPAA